MKLNNTCDFFNGKGIFTALSNKNLLYINPENALNLDIDFYLTYGNRETSPLVDYLLIDNKLTDESQNRLADIILNRFKSNWDRLDLAFNKEYNPIWNKDGTETTTVTNSGREVTFEKGEQSNTFNKGEESNTNDYGVELETVTNGATRQTNTLGTETETNSNGEQVTDYSEKITNVSNGERKSITENNIAAFNSNTYEKNNKTDVTDNASIDKTTENAHTVTNNGYTDTITKSGREDIIETDEVTNTTNKSAHMDIVTNSSREDNTIEGNRTDKTTEGENTITTTNIYGGNIGITSTQELLTQEFELRNKYNFYDIIFKNVQSILTDGYYNY